MANDYPDTQAAEALLKTYAPLISSLSAEEEDGLQKRSNAASPQAAILASAEPVSFSQATAGVNQAMSLIDQQIATIHALPWNFTGENQMQAAAETMKAALSGWPRIKDHMPMVAEAVQRLNYRANEAVGMVNAQNVAELSHDLMDLLHKVQPQTRLLAKAGTNFSDGVQSAYQAGANANQTAQNSINAQMQQIRMHLQDLQARMNDLRSAGSIILGILTFGGTIIAQEKEINRKRSELGAEQFQLMMNQHGYETVLGGFHNINSAVSVLIQVLQALDNALQQLANKLDDVIQQSSSNPQVAITLLKVFAQEVDAAAKQASSINA